MSIHGLLFAAAMAAPAEASVDASVTGEADAPVASEAEPPIERPVAAANAVPDAAWSAVEGKRVVVSTADGEVEGELAGYEGETLVLIADDGAVRTLPKVSATAVRVSKPPAAKPAAAPTAPRSQPEGEATDEATPDESKDESKDDKDRKSVV